MRILKSLAQRRGNEVSGSDLLLTGHNADNAEGADLVVYTAAIRSDNPEIIYAREHNIPLMTRGEYLGEVCKAYPLSVAVAGAHGKTTTTAMLWEALKSLNPTVHIGGEYNGYAAGTGGDELFITEACEYKRSFLSLHPDIAIALNIDLDHTDCYKDIGDMRTAFLQFILQSKRAALVNGDDPQTRILLDGLNSSDSGLNPSHSSRKILTVVLDECNDYRADGLYADGHGRYGFCVLAGGQRLGRVELAVAGRHNVYNALFAIAAGLNLGADFDTLANGLKNFKGTKRRLEFLGNKNDCVVFTDYAHHPKEIAMTVGTIKECNYKRITAVFEPHTYTRTKSFAREFADALAPCDEVVLLPVYAAREAPIEDGSSNAIAALLKAKGANVVCLEDYKSASEYLNRNVHSGVILFMGAGTVDGLAREFVK